MMKRFAALAAVAALAASPVAAQDAPVVQLTPDNAARWDVAGHAGWLGANKSEIAPDWDDWYDAGVFGASAGYYWTRNLKTEFEVATATQGTLFIQEQIIVPGQPFPSFRFGEHHFRTTGIAGSLVYQFFDNRWFHPFLAGGVEAVRETARIDVREQVQCIRAPCLPPSPLPTQTSVSYAARPFVTAGFKWYFSERGFVRSDIRSTFSTDHVESVVWRAGVGVDF